MTEPTLLEVSKLCAFYGQVQALRDVSLAVKPAGVTAVLGANGAGKTTLLRAICNMVRCDGAVRMEGANLAGWPTDRITRRGIALVPDGRGTVVQFTVEENLELGAMTQRSRAAIDADIERVLGYFPRLRERFRQLAGTLSGGEQQMLAVSRALMMRPRLLMLDEPSFGLSPRLVEEVFEILAAIRRDSRMGILLVEQNASLALELADDAVLLETGTVAMAGNAASIRASDVVRQAYLGED